MKSFWKVTNEVIGRSDVVIEVLDARFPDETRNKELEDKVKRQGKKLLFVLNKCDLISQEAAEKIKKKLKNCVFVSTTKKQGTRMLKQKILSMSSKRPLFVGTVGYPNTGKSSLANALKHRASASVSATSGHTKGKQLLRISKDLRFLDTPGVLEYKEKDEVAQALIGAKDAHKIKDPDVVAMAIIEKFMEQDPDKLKEFYKADLGDDSYDTLENIALRLKKMKKGGEPDIDAVSRKIVQDWQRGKLIL